MRTTDLQELTIYTRVHRSVIILTLQMGKLRLREAIKPVFGHQVGRKPRKEMGSADLSARGPNPARPLCL